MTLSALVGIALLTGFKSVTYPLGGDRATTQQCHGSEVVKGSYA